MSAPERAPVTPKIEFSLPDALAVEVVPLLQPLAEGPQIAIDPVEFIEENMGSPMANALAGAKRQIAQGLRQSRADRLEQEAALEADMHPVRRFFRSIPGDLLFKPVIEAIPGVGDAITFISAAKGMDILTGRPLKSWQRWAYAGASAIPFVPSGAIVGPIEGVKWLAEEITHAATTKNIRPLLHPKVLVMIVRNFT